MIRGMNDPRMCVAVSARCRNDADRPMYSLAVLDPFALTILNDMISRCLRGGTFVVCAVLLATHTQHLSSAAYSPHRSVCAIQQCMWC
jgi:hypothetical protein